jgi:chromosome segregation ATPase
MSETLWQITARHAAAARPRRSIEDVSCPCCAEKDAEVAALAKERDEFRLRVEQWRDRCAEAQAQIGAARAEVAEADGVIAVWRRRTEQAEAEAARLVGILRDLVDVQNGPPLEKYRADWEDAMERARAALAAKELA